MTKSGNLIHTVFDDIVLFDLDGTLTPHREKMKNRMIKCLKRLSNFSSIGIVTGSPIEFIKQQCEDLLTQENSELFESFDFFPCNGTQVHYWDCEQQDFFEKHSVDMKRLVGVRAISDLMRHIISIQNKFSKNKAVALTGDFITYRGSMINWCPIGRNASRSDRNKFVSSDTKHNLRVGMMSELKSLSESNEKLTNIDIVLGGQTSFDIFPKGWDKTYCLKYFPKNKRVWFVGDRCEGDGNDRTIYEKLSKEGRAFKADSPEDTIKIIDNEIIPRINALYE